LIIERTIPKIDRAMEMAVERMITAIMPRTMKPMMRAMDIPPEDIPMRVSP
jgi:hypothetical protein